MTRKEFGKSSQEAAPPGTSQILLQVTVLSTIIIDNCSLAEENYKTAI